MKDQNQVRLIDAQYSKVSEVLTRLTRSSKFTVELGDAICRGNEDRAVDAMRRELLSEPQPIVPATSKIGSSPFSAPIIYVQPSFKELKRRFPAYVNPDYKGKRFDPIERCKAVSKENREVAFEYVHMSRDASTDEVLAEMDRKGLRPALYEELLGFAEKYPDEQRKYPIVALGSETHVNGIRNVAYLCDDDDGRRLDLDWLDYDWDDYYRFLAVRK